MARPPGGAHQTVPFNDGGHTAIAITGTSASASLTINPASHTCGGGNLTGQHAIVVNAYAGAQA